MYGMWWGSWRKHDVVFISHPPINLPSSTTIPGPTTTSHTARPHNISVFPHHPPGYLEHIPSQNIFLPYPLSPNLHKTSPPTTPAPKTALPAAPPARLQSCPCLHAPVSTPAQHPPSRPLHPHPIPHLPGPSTTRTNAASPSPRPQPSILPPSLPLTSNIPQHTLKQSIPHIPLHLSSTHPAHIHSPKTRATAPSRSATCSLQTLHPLTGPTPFPLKP